MKLPAELFTILENGKIVNNWTNKVMSKKAVISMLETLEIEKNVSENVKQIKDYIENGLKIKRYAFSAGSSYYRINGYNVRVSNHFATSENHTDPCINAWSNQENGYVAIIEKIKQIAN